VRPDRAGLEQLRGGSTMSGALTVLIAMLVPAQGLLGTPTDGSDRHDDEIEGACAGCALLLGALGWWQWSRFSPPAEGPVAPASSEDLADVAAAPASAPVAAIVPASRAIRPQRSAEEREKTFAIIGTVVDDRNDRPIEGVAARVMAWTPRPESVATDATTGRDGKFAVPVHQKNRIRGVTFYAEHAPLVLDHPRTTSAEPRRRPDAGTIRPCAERVSGRASAETREPIPDAQPSSRPRLPGHAAALAEARPVVGG
jgi:hypothetical protein